MVDLKPPLQLVRAGSLLLAFFVVRGASAGEQLTPEQLVKEAVAVAVVDNPLRGSDLAVRRWLHGSEPAGPFSLTSPLCVPDKDMLLRWKKQSPKHPGAETWDKSISIGHVDQLVFFKVVKGVAVPFCETEIMLGTTFSTHPDYKSTVATVEGLLGTKLGVAPPPPPAPAPVEAPAAPPPSPPPTSPPPSSGSGCF